MLLCDGLSFNVGRARERDRAREREREVFEWI